MGVKQSNIKRMAREIAREHGDQATEDFANNKELLDGILDIKGKLVKNRIAGYIVRLKKRKAVK